MYMLFKNKEGAYAGSVSCNVSHFPGTCGMGILSEIVAGPIHRAEKETIIRAFIDWLTNVPINNELIPCWPEERTIKQIKEAGGAYLEAYDRDDYDYPYIRSWSKLDKKTELPLSFLFSDRYKTEASPKWARIFLTDNKEGEYDTKLFAQLANLPKFPYARNPNSGNYITHWYFDLVDDVV